MLLKRMAVTAYVLTIAVNVLAYPVKGIKTYSILQFGAKAGLNFDNTRAIQRAIDQAAKNKTGGKVLIPAGVFVTGGLVLKNGVELHLDDNALLFGSTDLMAYKKTSALIVANGQENIALSGNGTIDGRGAEVVQDALRLLRVGTITDPEWLTKRPTESSRPNILLFKNCRNVSVSGVTLKNSANWVQNYKDCQNVFVSHIRVESTDYWNNDGIDIVDSKQVRITDSYFNASDDGICLKSERADGACEDVLIENCTARTSANGFKLGTGSVGGFKNITVKNLMVYDTYRSAIAIESVDGAAVENVRITGVNAKNTGNALFIRLGHRNAGQRYSTIKNITINDLHADIPLGKPDIGYPLEGPPPKIPPHNLMPALIVGIPGHPVVGVSLNNITISYGGGASKSVAHIHTDSLASVPENIAGYPEFSMFGELPCWGVYARHTDSLAMQNVRLNFVQPDFRPAIVADDVKHLTMTSLNIATSEAPTAIVLNNVPNPVINNLRLPPSASRGVLTQNK